MKINSKNERVKRRYRKFLKEADGKSDQTIRQVDRAIARYEDFTGKVDFATFDQRKAIQFKNQLAEQDLAKATILSTVNALKRFLCWLSLETGYKSRIKKNNIEYLNLAEKDVRAARSPAERPFPSLEQVRKAISKMPGATPIELRDRAIVAMLALTGVRDGALITLKSKHLDMARGKVLQNPNEVATKRSKRIDTFLLNIAPEVKDMLLDWKRYQVEELMFAPNDPLFPATLVENDREHGFVAKDLSRHHWANAGPVRKIVQKAFEAAGLPYYQPHSFRNMLTQVGYELCKTPEELKIWSQNFGHDEVLTTLTSYGSIDQIRQAEVIGQLGTEKAMDAPLTKKDLLEFLSQNK